MVKQTNFLIQLLDGIFNKYVFPTNSDEGKVLQSTSGGYAVYVGGRIHKVPQYFKGTPEEYSAIIKKDLSSKL